MKSWIHLVLVSIIFVSTSGAPPKRDNLTVLAFFHGDDELSQTAFKAGIMRFNVESYNYNVVPKIYIIGRTDSFKAQQIVCEEVQNGIDAIFGPGSVETSGIVGSIAQRLDIPHLIYHWKSTPFNKYHHPGYKSTINLYPDSNVLAGAVAEVFKDYDWMRVAAVYEDKENLKRLKDVLQVYDPRGFGRLELLTLSKLDDRPREMLKKIKSDGIRKVVVDVNADKIIPLLQDAIKVKMFAEYVSYLFTNLDASIVDMSSFLPIAANLTSIRLTSETLEMEDVVNAWIQVGNHPGLDVTKVPHEAALIHDALMVYFDSLKANGPSHQRKNKLDCYNGNEKTSHGLLNLNFMKSKQIDGITGPIAFKKDGYNQGSRMEFRLEVLQLSKGVYKRLGSWDTNGMKYDTELQNPDDQLNEASQTKVFRILSKIGPPFLMHKDLDPEITYVGNDRYEGYVVDLCNAMKNITPMNFEIEIVKDYKAMQDLLIDEKADLAIADITITYERKTKVDFTSPFMTLGIGILYLKDKPKTPNSFSFLEPFDGMVWFYTALAYFGISIMVFILSRINKDDWESSHPCIQEPEEVESIWNFMNTVWLSMGSIMGQGCDILPKGSSTRIVAGMWFFFALIMLASYTANLAAFLTNAMGEKSIQSVEDLAKQTKTVYGAYSAGSTLTFFQKTDYSLYQRMNAFMETQGPSVHTDGNDAGVARVVKDGGDYAFLMETVPMDYFMARNCNLRRVGAPLDSKGYGIALPLNSPWRKRFNQNLLLLAESGVLSKLKTYWWEEWKTVGCDIEVDKVDHLTIAEVAGVFYVLIGGCIVALIVACFEFFFGVQDFAVEEKITFWEAFKSEIKFTFSFHKNSKPVRSGSSEATSRKSSPSRSLKSRSRHGSVAKSLKNKSTRSLNFDVMHESHSQSLLNLN